MPRARKLRRRKSRRRGSIIIWVDEKEKGGETILT
jgi:hypothetical protein